MRRKFTNEQLLELYNKGLIDKSIAKRLKVDKSSVSERRRKMGLPRLLNRPWTPEEDKILDEHYPTSSKELILKLLPNRSWSGIKLRAMKRGLKRICRSYIPPIERLPLLELTVGQRMWIACLIDCDGSICFHKQIEHENRKQNKVRYRPCLSATNTNRRILEFFREITGGLIGIDRKAKPRKTYYLQGYVARTHDMANVYALLNEVKSYLIIKREQADLIMEFIEIQSERLRKIRRGEAVSYTPRQLEIVNRVKRLNGHKGNVLAGRIRFKGDGG